MNITEYEPERWTVKKDAIYAAIEAVQSGLEHTRSALCDHDAQLGRTIAKNKWWAETMERDIAQMEKTLAMLKSLPSQEPV